MVVVMKLTSVDNNLYIIIFGILINKSVLSGIISQIQVILSVFMTLYPMNRGFAVAVILNTIEATSALMSALLHDNMNALPGIVMPVATIFVISIIFWYSKSLKKQMGKVIQNNAIIQENEKMLYQLAYYDSLTGLPNRKMMFDEIDRLADSYMADNKSFKFLYLDLDDFNKVNDIVSHSVGDMVLAKIVQRWRSVVRQEDILGRLGGDEFGLVITSDMEEDELKKFMTYQRSYQYQGVVAINISVVQLVEPNFVPMIKEALCETGFDSSLLELEITESVMISCPEKAIKTLNQLRELGIRISLDDFGTGYASLSYLQILPIDLLKIDKSFIDKICEQDYTNNIVGNIISLAHQLGIEVLAEGVELEEQRRYLTEQNCDFVQGYLLSRPLDEEKLIDLIKTV